MDSQNLVIIGIYLTVLSLLLFLSIRYREKFWTRFGSVLFPILLAVLFIYNLISFPAINQPYSNWAYQGRLQRLPSSELLDLFETSATPLRADWIYALVEDYYLGRTLLIPENIIDSLDLSLEGLLSQGRLADVEIIEFEKKLTADEVKKVLGMRYVDMPTREVDSKNNITTREGDVYYFILEEVDPNSPLLLLKHENQLFFIPEDLLPDLEGSL